MFDIGLFELMLIGIVMLIVVGPERLPKVARTAGHLLGRLQRYVTDVKSDIQREVQLDELKKMQSEMQDSARELQTSMRESVSEVSAGFSDSVGDAKASLAELETQLEADRATRKPQDAAQLERDLGGAEASSAPPSPQMELGLAEGAKAPDGGKR